MHLRETPERITENFEICEETFTLLLIASNTIVA
jgi:hypothetical protein